jgi:hypothetical protein
MEVLLNILFGEKVVFQLCVKDDLQIANRLLVKEAEPQGS